MSTVVGIEPVARASELYCLGLLSCIALLHLGPRFFGLEVQGFWGSEIWQFYSLRLCSCNPFVRCTLRMDPNYLEPGL